MKFMLQLIRSISVATTLVLGIAISIMLGMNLFYYQELFPGIIAPVYQLENLPPFEKADQIANPLSTKEIENAPMIRIYRTVKGKPKFVCSGTVVSNKYVITAGHCITDRKDQGLDTETKYIISNMNNTYSVEAVAAAVGPSIDYGLMLGDFTKFQKMKMSQLQVGFTGHKGPFLACGFPRGGVDHCKIFHQPSFMGYMNTGAGVQLYPGMSGGPVIDLSTQEIVGINSAVGQGFSVFAPIVNFFSAFDIEVK